MRAALRFLASVMMVSGALLVTDAVATLVWQEPVSAFLAAREQDALEEALFDPPQRVLRREPLEGDAIARLVIPAIGVSEYVVEGTDTADLRKGPGHYPETPLPGERGTAAIAGHRTTYGAPFWDVDKLEAGDEIVLETEQGVFDYVVTKTRIVAPTATEVTIPSEKPTLILTTCNPRFSARERLIVRAKQVYGKTPSGFLGQKAARVGVAAFGSAAA